MEHMSNYQSYQNQSLFDIAIELSGNPINAFLIAKHNRLVLSAPIPSGTIIKIPKGMNVKKEISEYYKINALRSATDLTKADRQIIEGCNGIECWTIGIDFKVS